MSQHSHLHQHHLEDLVAATLRTLQEAGIPLTEQRIAVIKTLAREPGYLSAEELHKKVPKGHRATVYRTLEVLHSQGLALSQSDGATTTYHLAADTDHPHVHLHCKSCSATTSATPEEFSGPANFQVDWHQSQLVGTCADCVAD